MTDGLKSTLEKLAASIEAAERKLRLGTPSEALIELAEAYALLPSLKKALLSPQGESAPLTETTTNPASEELATAEEVKSGIPALCPECGAGRADGHVGGWHGWKCGSFNKAHTWEPLNFQQSTQCATAYWRTRALFAEQARGSEEETRCPKCDSSLTHIETNHCAGCGANLAKATQQKS